MRPTLRQMQYLVAVADTGRFGEAARQLNVSQPSLSAQLAEVEALLGVTLVERGRSGAMLTPKGEDFVRRARSVLSQVEDLKAAMAHETGHLSGRIRLGVLPSIGPYLLPSAVKHLHAMHPELRLGVRDESTLELEARLRDGRLDTIISTVQDHRGSHSSVLFREDMWICVAEDDPLGGTTGPVSLGELEDRTLLSLAYGHRQSIIIQQLADLAGAAISAEYEGTSLDALRQMAAMGTGVAVLPSLYTVCEARRDPTLVLRRIDHPVAQREISLVWRDTSPLTANFSTLADVLSDVAAQLLGKPAAAAA
ncbi:MAG: hydrogen peroxide-inducible genes activator [Pseudomonadota bacterium]